MKNPGPNSSYTPISCDIYDHLEIWSMRRSHCRIIYMDGEHELCIQGQIDNLQTKDSVEYLIMNDLSIRLDMVISINDLKFRDSPTCNIQ